MSKPPLLNNPNPSLPASEDEMIYSLKNRIETLLSEILKLTDISNEALQNNLVWHKKYLKLKDLYLKNINDELTLEDLISGKLPLSPQDYPKGDSLPLRAEGDKTLEDMVRKNKELETELLTSQEELNNLKSQWSKLELSEGGDGNDERGIERKYQGRIVEVEEEIKRIKKENRERDSNIQNLDTLTSDLNKLKDEKRKMEGFYQKKLKEAEIEAKRRKKAASPVKNNPGTEVQSTSVNPVHSSVISNTINNPGTGLSNFGANNNMNNNNMGSNNTNLNDNRIGQTKAFGELETIKEIRTSEKIDELQKEDNSENKQKRIPEIVKEETPSSRKKIPPQSNANNNLQAKKTTANTGGVGKTVKREPTVKKTVKK